MTQGPLQAARAADGRRRENERLIRAIVAAEIREEIAARRPASPLRRRWLDEIMATTSRQALAAGARPAPDGRG